MKNVVMVALCVLLVLNYYFDFVEDRESDAVLLRINETADRITDVEGKLNDTQNQIQASGNNIRKTLEQLDTDDSEEIQELVEGLRKSFDHQKNSLNDIDNRLITIRYLAESQVMKTDIISNVSIQATDDHRFEVTFISDQSGHEERIDIAEEDVMVYTFDPYTGFYGFISLDQLAEYPTHMKFSLYTNAEGQHYIEEIYQP